MIGAIVTFRFDDSFDAEKVAKIAAEAAPRFEGMPGLRSKAFTFDEANGRAINFYLWESDDAARAFFNDELLDRVTGLYGVKPTIDFVEIAALVDNNA